MISAGTVELGLTFVVIPWCVWVTVSLFNQRQQIALLRQEIALLKDIKIIVSKYMKK